MEERCPGCGARLAEGAAWCGLCGRSRVSAEEAAALLAEATAPRQRWRPHERHTAAKPVAVHSRWRRGPLSLGPVGRIVATILPTWLAAWLLIYSGSPGSGLVVGAVLPLVYWDIWKRRRIR